MATPSKPREIEKIAREVSRDNSPDNAVVQALRQQTANAFVLYANYKHYHWQTFGPLFRDLHKLFDELALEVLSTVDELAERVRMIGQDPPAHLLESASVASVAPTAANTTMREMVEEAQRNVLTVISEMRKAAKVVRGEAFLRLRVPPEQELAARAALATVTERGVLEGAVEVVADPGLPDLACVLESEAGVVSAGLDVQLAAVNAAVVRELGRLAAPRAAGSAP